MFIENDQNLLYPNPSALDERKEYLREAGFEEGSADYVEGVRDLLRRYEFLGRIIGKCLYEGILIDIQFAPFFLVKWALTGGSGSATNETNYRANLNDLRDLDETLYQGLVGSNLSYCSFRSETDLVLVETKKLSRQCRRLLARLHRHRYGSYRLPRQQRRSNPKDHYTRAQAEWIGDGGHQREPPSLYFFYGTTQTASSAPPTDIRVSARVGFNGPALVAFYVQPVRASNPHRRGYL